MDDEIVTQVWLSVHKSKLNGEEVSSRQDVIHTNDEEGIKLIFSLFKIIKNEVSAPTEITDDNVFKSLNNFITEFQKNPDLEQPIKKKIKKLGDYKFSKGFIDVSEEKIINQLKSLREKRIKFWNSVLEIYIENREEYNTKLKNYFKAEKPEI